MDFFLIWKIISGMSLKKDCQLRMTISNIYSEKVTSGRLTRGQYNIGIFTEQFKRVRKYENNVHDLSTVCRRNKLSVES